MVDLFHGHHFKNKYTISFMYYIGRGLSQYIEGPSFFEIQFSVFHDIIDALRIQKNE